MGEFPPPWKNARGWKSPLESFPGGGNFLGFVSRFLEFHRNPGKLPEWFQKSHVTGISFWLKGFYVVWEAYSKPMNKFQRISKNFKKFQKNSKNFKKFQKNFKKFQKNFKIFQKFQKIRKFSKNFDLFLKFFEIVWKFSIRNLL